MVSYRNGLASSIHRHLGGPDAASSAPNPEGLRSSCFCPLGYGPLSQRYVSMECRALGGPERIRVANRDIPTLHRYCAIAAELRQSTADGLHGQTEVVGDVAAIHGQTYLRRRVK